MLAAERGRGKDLQGLGSMSMLITIVMQGTTGNTLMPRWLQGTEKASIMLVERGSNNWEGTSTSSVTEILDLRCVHGDKCWAGRGRGC